MRARILRPHTSISASDHMISRMYLVVLVVILSSTSACDPTPDDEEYGSGSDSGFSYISETTSTSIPEDITNVSNTDQLEVTTNPVHLNASTNEIYCNLLVTAQILVLIMCTHIST